MFRSINEIKTDRTLATRRGRTTRWWTLIFLSPGFIYAVMGVILIYLIVTTTLVFHLSSISTHKESRFFLFGRRFDDGQTTSIVNRSVVVTVISEENETSSTQAMQRVKNSKARESESNLGNKPPLGKSLATSTSKLIEKTHGGHGKNYISNRGGETTSCRYQWSSWPDHGCVIDPGETKALLCQFQHFRVDVDLIDVSHGGENLTAVMGRAEEEEFPRYMKGAFRTFQPFTIPDYGRKKYYYLQDVLGAIEENGNHSGHDELCDVVETTPTLFITRYEYANLFHTMTDWFNTYWSLPSHDIPRGGVNMVFLDGHARGNLDDAWKHMFGFGNVTHVKHLPSGGICFDRAIMVPPGYLSALWSPEKAFKAPKCPHMLDEFAKFVLNEYGLDNIQMIRGRVVIIERVGYVSHPRSNPIATQRLIDNLDELEDQLNDLPGIDAHRMQFEHMDFREQVRAVRSAQILIGNHGAGMTHFLFMEDGAQVMEFRHPSGAIFSFLAEWKPGLTRHLLPSATARRLSQGVIRRVVERVRHIVQDENF